MKRSGPPKRKVRVMVTLRCEDCRQLFQRRKDAPTRTNDGAVLCNHCSRVRRSTGRDYTDRLNRVALTCDQCGVEFWRRASALGPAGKFCGRACWGAWQRAHPRPWVGQVDNSGPRNGRYKDGRRVGTNTSARRLVRVEVAQRDGDWCLLCGLPPKGLHLHRVVYGSQGGKYVTGNCVQLCGSHHALVHGNKPRWQPLLLAYLAAAPEPEAKPVLAQLQALLAS